MIQSVSTADRKPVIPKINRDKVKEYTQQTKDYAIKYKDSFSRNATEMVVPLLGLTGAYSYLEHISTGISFKKAFPNRFSNFFVPVLLGASALLAGIESMPEKSSKKK